MLRLVRALRDSGAGMARIAGKDRTTAEGWRSGGLLPHWISDSCDDLTQTPVS